MSSDRLPGEINVKYRQREGYHIFTSEDVYGLYIARKDLRAAFDSIAPALQELFRLNRNVDCSIRPADSFREFEARVQTAKDMAATMPPLADSLFLMDCHE